jgi:hypothetical protein
VFIEVLEVCKWLDFPPIWYKWYLVSGDVKSVRVDVENFRACLHEVAS